MGRAFSFVLKKGATMSNKDEMLVNRLTNLWRKPLARPARHGKTARDHASGSWVGSWYTSSWQQQYK